MNRLRWIISAVLAAGIVFSVAAQGAKTDSLKQLALTSTDDSVKISALLQLAFQSIFNDSKAAWQQLTEVQQLLARKIKPTSRHMPRMSRLFTTMLPEQPIRPGFILKKDWMQVVPTGTQIWK